MSVIVKSHHRAGLCNRLQSIGVLLKFCDQHPDIDVKYYWENTCVKKHPSFFLSFDKVFEIYKHKDKIISCPPYRKKPSEILITKDNWRDHNIFGNGNYVTNGRAFIGIVRTKKMLQGVSNSKLEFNKHLKMTNLTKGYYNKLREKYLDIFTSRNIVFLRCNDDMIGKFNTRVDEAARDIENMDNPYFIYDTTTDRSYENLIKHLPCITRDNSFNMFTDLSDDKHDRFIYMVALLFLAFEAKFPIVNINWKSSYGGTLKRNSSKKIKE